MSTRFCERVPSAASDRVAPESCRPDAIRPSMSRMLKTVPSTFMPTAWVADADAPMRNASNVATTQDATARTTDSFARISRSSRLHQKGSRTAERPLYQDIIEV